MNDAYDAVDLIETIARCLAAMANETPNNKFYEMYQQELDNAKRKLRQIFING